MNEAKTAFTREKLPDAIHIWNRSAITLLDIRHNLISREAPLSSYRLPASAFLYTRGEKAEICIDSTFYSMERFGVFHSYRGAELTITPRSKWLEYYTVLYRAGEPPFHKSEFSRLMAQTNPFRQQYGFLPSNPLFFAEQLRKMYEKWKGPTPLNLFYDKTAFYQLVYEIYEELEQGSICVLEPDIVSIAKRYLETHYKDSVGIQELCDSLGVSHSHFHRSFKQQTGKSPQEYLIKTRFSAAMKALENGDSSIREIAIHCGFPDEINFYRQFVKHVGVAPSIYKQNLQRDMSDCAMENLIPFPYNWESRVRLDKLKGEGATFMSKQIRGKAIMAAALSLMLLLSACGTAPANSSGVDSSPTAALTSQVETEGAESVEEGTRTVSTVMGDVEVPVNPQRVACYTWTGDLLTLGITPVVSNDANMDIMKDLLPGVELSWFDDVEEVMASDPDLIIIRDKTRLKDMFKSLKTQIFMEKQLVLSQLVMTKPLFTVMIPDMEDRSYIICWDLM